MNQSEERIPRRDNSSSILSKHKRNNNQLACLEIHNSWYQISGELAKNIFEFFLNIFEFFIISESSEITTAVQLGLLLSTNRQMIS